jgi:hypothetical protein
MKNQLVVLLTLCLAAGCKDSGTEAYPGADVLPQVRFSQTNYSQAVIMVGRPDTVLLPLFTRTYGGRYSDGLKASLVHYILDRTRQAGFDEREVQACLQATGQLESGGESLPYLAERAKYDGQEAWVFEFTYGFDGSFGHYRCFVIGAQTLDTLFYESCR